MKILEIWDKLEKIVTITKQYGNKYNYVVNCKCNKRVAVNYDNKL